MKRSPAAPPTSPSHSHSHSHSHSTSPSPALLAPFVAGLVVVLAAANPAARAAPVTVTERDVVVPTYLAGEPEPNPIFYARRSSQGAQGRVYPYPLYDALTHRKVDRTYRVVYLENDFVRIGILPEIGGRLFEAVDKSNGYHFIYRQHVIKPALISLIGAWISGGIEWNIPHHHRASTILPVQWRTEEHADGSRTVWVGELEVRHRMRWAVGYTLRPDRSYLECRVRILNRTPVANTMLCFANVAVHVNPRYQVIFPPSTRFVTFHSKTEFATWPIARSVFNRADFTRGVDVSWYASHVSPNSMFAWNYEDDFFAGYDHGRNAGIMSVADHHVVPGKKFWTWGNGPRGRHWDQVLTDDDGPYIELMVGAYSDNQPDYSWLQPHETKSFEMFWYPFRDIGGVKHANLDAAVNLELVEGGSAAKLGFCVTAEHRQATVKLTTAKGGQTLLEEIVAIGPGKPFVKEVRLPAGVAEHDLHASLSAGGRELVAYAPRPAPEPSEMPERVRPPSPPAEIGSVEELYLTGRRVEQFHSPDYEPEPFWEEALRRDPGESRVHTALAIRKIKQAHFSEAEAHLRAALNRLTARHTTPKEGEPFYYLGVALRAQGKEDEAFDALYKATWSQAWRSPAYLALAEIRARRGDLADALRHVDRAVDGNGLNLRALTLKASLLRHLDRAKEALAVLDVAAAKADPLDVRLMAERWLASGRGSADELRRTLREHPATALETAVEYDDAGLLRDAQAVLGLYVESAGEAAAPLALYLLADVEQRLGDADRATALRRRAKSELIGTVFPFQHELIPVLRRAAEADPADAKAPLHLGNLLYDWQPEEAVKAWERSAAIDAGEAITHRNLAFAYSHRKPVPDLAKAIAALERAVACPTKYALHFAELDDLYSAARVDPARRLALLEANHDVVARRDDALSKEIGLKVLAGKLDEAIALMTGRTFAVWEGGRLAVAEHWVDAHVLRARRSLAAKRYADALADLEKARRVPPQLTSDQDAQARAVEIAWWVGATHEASGDADKARQAWAEAAGERSATTPSSRGPSARGFQAYYRILALRKLGRADEARAALAALQDSARRAVEQQARPRPAPPATLAEYRARNEQAAFAHCLAALAHLAAGDEEKATASFRSALQAAPDYLPARQMLPPADVRPD